MCNSAVILASQFSSNDFSIKLESERRNDITYSLIKSQPYFSCIGLFMYYLKDFRKTSSFKSNILASQYKNILDNVTLDKEFEPHKRNSYNKAFKNFRDYVISPESQLELDDIKERNENIKLLNLYRDELKWIEKDRENMNKVDKHFLDVKIHGEEICNKLLQLPGAITIKNLAVGGSNMPGIKAKMKKLVEKIRKDETVINNFDLEIKRG